MEGYDEATYGDRIADVYDDWYGEITDTAACVDGLRRLAGDGPVLELGVGTGRLAIPLAGPGCAVTGVDSSAAMLERLAAKPGGAQVETVAGDMADPPVGDRRFSLVFAAYNTLFNLIDPGAQQACFEKVAALLTGDGRFVVEAFVPDADRVGPTDVVVPRQVAADRVVLSVTQSRPGDQTLLGQYIDITEDGIRLRPWHIRYAGPDELDAMANAAGLRLEARCGGLAGRAVRRRQPDAHLRIRPSGRGFLGSPPVGRIQVSTVIDAPPATVWDVVRHIERHVDWMVDAEAIRFTSDQRTGLGTAFDCETRIGPFQLTDRMEITEWQPGQTMGVRHRGLVTGQGRFTLAAAGGRPHLFRLGRATRVPVVDGWPGGRSGRRPRAATRVEAQPPTSEATRGVAADRAA